MAAGQSQRFYSGVGIFNWYYLSSPPQILRVPGVPLETGGLAHNIYYMRVYTKGLLTPNTVPSGALAR